MFVVLAKVALAKVESSLTINNHDIVDSIPRLCDTNLTCSYLFMFDMI